jgi:hypothetical protein
MNKNFKFNQKTMLVVALLALIVFYLWSRNISSYAEIGSSSDSMPMMMPSSQILSPSTAPSSYEPPFITSAPSSFAAPSSYQDEGLLGMRADDQDAGYATLDADFGSSSMGQEPNCALGSGIGLASSLLPREVAKVENFGDFAPDDILRGQNFLDTRNQIGFPETLGGNIRNGNQQIRADPPNPKQPYIWNNSTIVPDLMQRDLCS